MTNVNARSFKAAGSQGQPCGW